MEKVQCNLCGSDDAVLVATERQHGYQILNVICRKCTLVYANPRLTAAEYRSFYASRYRQLYCGSSAPTASSASNIRSRIGHIERFCRDYLLKSRRVLEVGCATGVLLANLRDRYGCEVQGIEPSIDYGHYAATEHKVAVFSGTLEEYAKQAKTKWDLILMVHVLEHFVDPSAALRSVRELLSDDGAVYIEVPNVLWHHSFEVAHPFSFHANSLANLTLKEGFQPLTVITHGFPRWPRVPFHLVVTAKKAAGAAALRDGPTWSRVLQMRRRGRMCAQVIEIPERMFGWIVLMMRRTLSEKAYTWLRGKAKKLYEKTNP